VTERETEQQGAPAIGAVGKSAPRGFSLIEIMVVLVLIGMVVSLVTVNVMSRLDQGKIDTARSQSYELGKSLDIYKLQTGSYPTTAQGLQSLVSPPKGKPILDSLPKDPWNNDYILVVPGQKNPTKFDVRSKGPDGQEGTEDDVGNWPAE
jgi:general secretion pathway protein G